MPCNFACNKLYNEAFGMWLPNGKSEPTLFISTEQELEEVKQYVSFSPEDILKVNMMRNVIHCFKRKPLYIRFFFKMLK